MRSNLQISRAFRSTTTPMPGSRKSSRIPVKARGELVSVRLRLLKPSRHVLDNFDVNHNSALDRCRGLICDLQKLLHRQSDLVFRGLGTRDICAQFDQADPFATLLAQIGTLIPQVFGIIARAERPDMTESLRDTLVRRHGPSAWVTQRKFGEIKLRACWLSSCAYYLLSNLMNLDRPRQEFSGLLSMRQERCRKAEDLFTTNGRRFNPRVWDAAHLDPLFRNWKASFLELCRSDYSPTLQALSSGELEPEQAHVLLVTVPEARFGIGMGLMQILQLPF